MPPSPATVCRLLLPTGFAFVVSLTCSQEEHPGPEFRGDNISTIAESLASASCSKAAECGSLFVKCLGGDDGDGQGTAPQDCTVHEQEVDFDTCLAKSVDEVAASLDCLSPELVEVAEQCFNTTLAAACPSKEALEAEIEAQNGGYEPKVTLTAECKQLQELASACHSPASPGLFPSDNDIIHRSAPQADRTKMTSRPCGDRTLATLEVDTGQYLYFCDLGDGIGMGEAGPLHQDSVLADTDYFCPLHIFEDFAPPGLEPPERLREDCEFRTAAWGPSAEPLDLAAHVPVSAAHYCGASGAANFDTQRCLPKQYGGYYWNCGGQYRCTQWCQNGTFSWHQRSTSGQWSQEGDNGIDIIASCGGSTRFRGWWDGSVSFDNNVLANYWQWHTLTSGDSLETLPDHEIKFRGDSYSGASHRFAGQLEDWNWP